MIHRDPMTGLMCTEWFNTTDRDHRRYILSRVTDVDVAASYCRKKAVAVQAGGYIGLWPLQMIKFFAIVHTFEPIAENYECLVENTKYAAGIVCHPDVLGAVDGAEVQLKEHKGWGSHVTEEASEGTVTRSTKTIDSLGLKVCDLIYLDIEMHELQALAGAAETIKLCGPVIALETHESNRTAYDAYMKSIGYQFVKKTHADVIYTPA